MQYWESLAPKSYLDVFNAVDTHKVTLNVIKSECGDAVLKALMVKWITGFAKFYSVNGTMDAYQIAELINLILEEYPHYTQEDFKLFFKQAKKGYFEEKVFGRVDGEIILRWLSIYDHQRRLAAQDLAIKQQERFKCRTDENIITNSNSYQEYLKIKKMALKGDLEAIEQLNFEKQKNHESNRLI